MKRIVEALKEQLAGRVTPIEGFFDRFALMGESEIEQFQGTREDHTLLAAFRVLRAKGVHYGSARDREEQSVLLGILKAIKEETTHEDLQSGRECPGKRTVRVRDGSRRALPVETEQPV